VELADGLSVALRRLGEQGQEPIVSSWEAYLEDVSVVRSFSPMAYVNDPATVTDFGDVTRTSPAVALLVATTENVRAVTRDVLRERCGHAEPPSLSVFIGGGVTWHLPLKT